MAKAIIAAPVPKVNSVEVGETAVEAQPIPNIRPVARWTGTHLESLDGDMLYLCSCGLLYPSTEVDAHPGACCSCGRLGQRFDETIVEELTLWKYGRGPQGVLSDIDRVTRMYDVYKSGVSLGRVGKQFGISRQRVFQLFQKHNLSVRDRKAGVGRGTTEYSSWSHMIWRCYNPNSNRYARYGGRGITVCDRWRRSFADFLSDMGPKPTPEHSIDRINNDGNYEPGNTRWATPLIQGRNKQPRQKKKQIQD